MILTLDIGTSSVRAICWSRTLQQLFAVSAEYRMNYALDGSATVDADELVNLVFTTVDDVVRKCSVEYLAVAVSTFWHSLIALDEDYKPKSELLSWNDTRSRQAASLLRSHFDERSTHLRTGCRFHSSYWPAKIVYLQSLGVRAAKYASFSDYLFLKLFGKFKTTHSIASATGLYQQSTGTWDEVLSEYLAVQDKLPAIDDEPETYLLQEYAQRWPALKKAIWYPPVGDGAASNVGCGCLSDDKAALMIGTSGAIRIVTQKALLLPALWQYKLDRSRAIVGAAVSNGGNLYRWLVDTLKLDSRLEEVAAQLAADSHGLTILPHLSGERSPCWNDASVGVILGLRLSTTALDIFRATLEALALQFYPVFAQLEQAVGKPVSTVVATGRALIESQLLQRIFCDVLGVHLLVSDVAEASSRGAALLALKYCGEHITNLPSGRWLAPDPRAHEVYVAAASRQYRLYKTLYPDVTC
ncbi:MAG: gluconokinase [Acidobacteriota bacterium]|nr:gluconokinase [Blastocatellia bacterium]MDW8413187.1 gluconokinase [Acidobacteriota bacterium]